MHFTRPDYTEEIFQRDWTDCESKAGTTGYGGFAARDYLRRCMIGKGWKAE